MATIFDIRNVSNHVSQTARLYSNVGDDGNSQLEIIVHGDIGPDGTVHLLEELPDGNVIAERINKKHSDYAGVQSYIQHNFGVGDGSVIHVVVKDCINVSVFVRK